MKKTPLLFAGIIAATILVVMGMGILLTGSFYFIPSITIDPFGDGEIDENGMLVLTGTTNLGVNTFLLVNVTDGSPGGEKATSLASVLPGSGGRNTWKAAVNVSPLPPGTYMVRVSSVDLSGNNRTAVPGRVSVTAPFTLPEMPSSGDRALPTPFLRANRIGEWVPGERIDLSGVTNLGPGTELLWRVDPVRCPGPEGGIPVPAGQLPNGSTVVTGGISGINRWSFSFDSAGISAGCYLVNITRYGVPGEPLKNRTGDSVEFRLSASAPKATPTPSRYITIDTIPDIRENTRVTVTGTSSLSPGEELVVEITPTVSSGYSFVVDPEGRARGGVFAGVTGTAVVVQGTAGANHWSMDFDTFHLPQGEYELKVANPELNDETTRIGPGDVSCTTRFTVRGDA